MPAAENLQRILITQAEKDARNSLRKQLKSTAEDKYISIFCSQRLERQGDSYEEQIIFD